MNDGPTVIALGGGGARGLAHLGVLEVLEQTGVGIDRIVGVSIGGIIGAAYAFDPDIERTREHVLDYVMGESFQRHQRALTGAGRKPAEGASLEAEPRSVGVSWFNQVRDYLRANRLFNRVITKKSLLASQLLEDVAANLLPDADIADAAIPLTIVSVDLRSGHRVVLEKGDVRKAVRGSASLPGIFPPVELDGMLLADIGIFSPLPTQVCRLYDPGMLIAADVSPRIQPIDDCDTALGVMMRMEEIAGTVFRDHVLSLADIIIHPEVGSLPWSDFTQSPAMVDRGRIATREVRDAVLAQLGPRVHQRSPGR